MGSKDAAGLVNSVDSHPTAPSGAVGSGSALFDHTYRSLYVGFGSLQSDLDLHCLIIHICLFTSDLDTWDLNLTVPLQSDLDLHCLTIPICPFT